MELTEGIIKILSSVTASFRHAILFSVGGTYILLLDYVYRPNLQELLPNLNNAGLVMQGAAFVFVAYLIGRLIRIVSRLYIVAVEFVFIRRCDMSFISKLFKGMSDSITNETLKVSNPERMSLAELTNTIHNNQALSRKLESREENYMFRELSLGWVLAALWFFPQFWGVTLILVIVLTNLVLFTRHGRYTFWNDILLYHRSKK